MVLKTYKNLKTKAKTFKCLRRGGKMVIFPVIKLVINHITENLENTRKKC